MKVFRLRRPLYALALPLLMVMILFITDLYQASLRETGYFTGWLLFVAIFLLSILNWRKKIAVFPLGSVFEWVQLHIYLGWLAVFLFALHLSWRLPDGPLEGVLSLLFVVVIVSGIIGLYLSISLPRRLTRRGEEVLFERIPGFRDSLMAKAQNLALSSIAETRSSTLADFYSSRLRHFFQRPRNVFQHLIESNRARFILDGEMAALQRYMNEQERDIFAKLKLLVEQKDDLDYHYALQGALKLWLFIHIPAASLLGVLTLLHLLLVYAFKGWAL